MKEMNSNKSTTFVKQEALVELFSMYKVLQNYIHTVNVTELYTQEDKESCTEITELIKNIGKLVGIRD